MAKISKDDKMIISGYEFDYIRFKELVARVGIKYDGAIYDHGSKEFLKLDTKKLPKTSANGVICIVQNIELEKIVIFTQATVNIHNACCKLNVTKSDIYSNKRRSTCLLNSYIHEDFVNDFCIDNRNFYLCYKPTETIYTSRSIYSVIKNSYKPKFNHI